MRCIGSTVSRFVIVMNLIMSMSAYLGAAPGDEYWDDGFYMKSLDGSARCVAVADNGDIYVGGNFKTSDDVLTNGVGMWDGTSWHAVGGGFNSGVKTLVFGQDGRLYAGGDFSSAGGDPDADHVAVLDDRGWVSLGGPGSGLNNSVEELVVHDSGVLIAGGAFTDAGGDAAADRIAVWDGDEWGSIGGHGSGVNGTVYSMALAPDGLPVIGGFFTDAGGVATADRVAKWSPGGWQPLGGGLNAIVFELAFADNGDLYAGGGFTSAGGDPHARSIAVWDGSNWSSVGGSASSIIGAIYSIVFDDSGRPIVGGNFSFLGGVSTQEQLITWFHGAWETVGGESNRLNASVHGLGFDDRGDLIALGDFTDAGGGPSADRIARWDGGRWNAYSNASLSPGSGLNYDVQALAFDDQGRLLAGGKFQDAGGHPAADFIARWDDSGWSPLGAAAAFDNEIHAIVTATGGEVIVGGLFEDAGGDPDADRIAVWDGAAWSSLGGSGTGLGGDVHALAVGAGGLIYAGGDFEDAGGDPDADRLAVWDGFAWSSLGGPNSGLNDSVLELIFDGTGNLLAGGAFTDAGGDQDADRLAVWNGSTWTSLGGPGNGVGGDVRTLAVDDHGHVFVGGDFFNIEGVAGAAFIAEWTGTGWIALGDGLDWFVRDLVFDGAGNLFATGYFFDSESRIAFWDGSSWNRLGSGLNYPGLVLAYDGGSDLFVGGKFWAAGLHTSNRIARWRNAEPAGLLFRDGFESGNSGAWSSSTH